MARQPGNADLRETTMKDANEEWDWSRERQFMENLLNQRFNFLVVFVSVISYAAAQAWASPLRTLILAAGAVFTLLVGLTVYRVNRRLHIIIDTHLKRVIDHPVTVTYTECDAGGWKNLFRVRWIIGALIPGLAFLGLAIAAVLSAWLPCTPGTPR
jgi:hypothetical protein